MGDEVATEFVPVSKEDIAAFAAKLESWGTSLSAKEEALFHLLLGRAKALEPQDVKRAQFQEGITQAITAVYVSIVKAWTGSEPAAVVQVDPITYKAASGEEGEEVQITAQIGKLP